MTPATATKADMKAVVVSGSFYLIKHSDNSFDLSKDLKQATRFTPEVALQIALDKATENGWCYSVKILPRRLTLNP